MDEEDNKEEEIDKEEIKEEEKKEEIIKDDKKEEIDKEEIKEEEKVDADKEEVSEPEENGEVENEEIAQPKEETGKQSKEESKQLKKIFLVLGFLVSIFVVVLIFINASATFTYDGIDFETVKSGDLILYKTSLPVNSDDHKITGDAVSINYNFYLRNDPRKLKNIPLKLDENLNQLTSTVINFTEGFNCDGMGVVAVTNLANLLKVLDAEVMKDETAVCDPEGRYTFLRLQRGNETSIEQFGPSCYNLNINNCEILDVTEKYMLELLSIINERLP